MTGRWLRISRIVIAVVCFVAATAIIVSGNQRLLDAVCSLHILEAVVSFSMTVFVFWLIVTLIFGRIYCSTVCPTGVFQDICARLRRMAARRDRRERLDYHYSRPLSRIRTIFLLVTLATLVAGILIIGAILDPFGIYQRFIDAITGHISECGFCIGRNEVAAWVNGSVAAAVFSVAMIIVIGGIASRHGRTFCNSVCPVGTTLGLISRYSFFRIDINTDRCTHCRRCEHVCKASCIDLTDHVVDGSRCVNCFDCISVCPDKAISYTPDRHQLSIPMLQRVETAPTAINIKQTLNETVSSTSRPHHDQRR